MNKILIVLFAILISSPLLSQNDDKNEKGDKKSREILDRLTAKTEAYSSVSVEFAYKMKNEDADIDEQTFGKLTVMGNKYILNIAGQKVICDGTTIWTYIEDAEEVQINSLEDSEESISPSKLLSSYNDDYRSKFIQEDFMCGTQVHIIDLTPIEGKSYFKVRLVIDKIKDQLLEVTIYDKNGSTYSYIISKFLTNQPVNESDFTFNKKDYPGVEVVDMR